MHGAFSCNVNNNIFFFWSSSFNYTCVKDTLLIIILISDFYNTLQSVIFTFHMNIYGRSMNKLPSIVRIVKSRWLQCWTCWMERQRMYTQFCWETHFNIRHFEDQRDNGGNIKAHLLERGWRVVAQVNTQCYTLVIIPLCFFTTQFLWHDAWKPE